MIDAIARRLKADIDGTDLAHFLDPLVTLVPVPRAAPFSDPKSLWPAMRICEALREQGFGGEVLPCLKRLSAVRRSSHAAPGQRPLPYEHLDSMEVTPTMPSPEKITLVDDVVTKGATLLAAASLVQDAFPKAEVRAFALIRTLGLVPDIDALIQPVTGSISELYGEALREP
jgi:hypothetical protein